MAAMNNYQNYFTILCIIIWPDGLSKNSTNASQQEPDNQKLYVTVQINKSEDKNKISQD